MQPPASAPQPLHPLERAVLDWIAERTPQVARHLARVSTVHHRAFTNGVGAFVGFLPDDDAPAASPSPIIIDGPIITSPVMDAGALTMLWLCADGRPDYLEIWAGCSDYPQDRHPDTWTLSVADVPVIEDTEPFDAADLPPRQQT